MICPKCQGLLRTVDKQGVHLEQCETCRGIFLDHGELEQILHAEQRYYYYDGGAVPYVGPRGRPDSPRPYRGGHYPDSPRPYGNHRPDSPRPYGNHRPDSPRPYGHRRHGRDSFLRDLFN